MIQAQVKWWVDRYVTAMIKELTRLRYSDAGLIDSAWAYELTADMRFDLGRDAGDFEVWMKYQQIAVVKKSTLTIREGYAWDGLTCWNDSPANMIAGLPHDFGYQCGGIENTPFDRLEVDGWLRDLARSRKAWDAKIIYAGVRLMGWKFYGKGKGDVEILGFPKAIVR